MPEDAVDTLLMLNSEDIPEALRTWLTAVASHAVFASLELLPDGRLVIQALPGVDPLLVARVRRLMAQHDDVLRRLT